MRGIFSEGKVVLVVCIVLFGWSLVGSGAVTPAAAQSAGPAVVHFTASSANRQPPAETVLTADLRLGGAAYPGCLTQPEEPRMNFYTSNLDLTGIAIISSCGWQPGETVKVTLMAPQGKYYTREVKAVPARLKPEVYQVDLFFQPGVDAPDGFYRFTLEGESATLKAKVNFLRPDGARLYVATDDPFSPHFGALGGQQRLRLEGFLPEEPVRLLAYRFEGTLIQFYGWQDYTTDLNGRLLIETDLPEIDPETEMNYYVYGRDTHFVALERFTAEGYRKSRRFDMDLYCPGAQTPRLSGVDTLVPAAGVTRLELHQQPGFGSRVVTEIPADTPVHLFGLPKCIDRAFWWPVSISKPIRFGWVAESRLGRYLVEPGE